MPTEFYSLDEMADFMRDWDGANWTWAQGATISYNTTGLTEAAATLARVAFQLWDEASDLSFTEVTTGGDITLDDTNEGAYGGPSGYYYLSDPTTLYATSGHINVQQDWNGESDPGFNSYTLQTFIHEIGHVLGMGHSGHYNGSANYANDALYVNDTWQYTVMSYFGQHNYDGGSHRYLSTPMMADYYYMEMVYGAADDTRTGDTTYGFNSNAGTYEGFDLYNFAAYATAPAMTIFDSAGIDTLDASGYSNDQFITLVAGTFSDIGGYNNNVGIAHNTIIENAIGGTGHDTIAGNESANAIDGNEGDDLLIGGFGADDLRGGDGLDTASYADSDVAVRILMQQAVATGGTAEGDRFDSIENLRGSSFDDVLSGDAAHNVIHGGDGIDRLNGNNGEDVIYGDAGDDVLNGGSQADHIFGGLGFDRLTGGTGADVFVYTSLADSFHATARDVIRDFVTGLDKIDLSATGFDDLVTAFTGEAGQLRSSMTDTTTTIVGDLNGDRVVDFRLTLTGLHTLSDSDFVF